SATASSPPTPAASPTNDGASDSADRSRRGHGRRHLLFPSPSRSQQPFPHGHGTSAWHVSPDVGWLRRLRTGARYLDPPGPVVHRAFLAEEPRRLRATAYRCGALRARHRGRWGRSLVAWRSPAAVVKPR